MLPKGDHAEVAAALGKPSRAELLTPSSRGSARKGSLSSQFGLDAFPWHTDGVVALRPPDWLVLRGVTVGAPTRTEVALPSPALIKLLARTVLKTTTPSGATRYFPAYIPKTSSGRSRIRWDESKSIPNRPEAKEAIRCLQPSQLIPWHEGQIVILDNRRCLHRRPALNDDQRVIERTYVWED